MKRAWSVSFILGGSLGLLPACEDDGGTAVGASSGRGGGGGESSNGTTQGDSDGGGQESNGAPGEGSAASGPSGFGGSLGAGPEASGGGNPMGGAAGSESGGAFSIGGETATDGGTPTGGADASGGGGASSSGGSSVGGAMAAGGQSNGGQTASGDCVFSVTTNELSPQMATVGLVEWSVDGVPTDASIVYELEGASAEVLNRGGEAPVDLARENFRTLLLGLKQESSYRFFIRATVAGEACVSEPYALPPTGTLSSAPSFSVAVEAPDAREPGFIVAATGYTGNPDNPSFAFILDADGDTVWSAAAPSETSRAKMDYEGDNMWMMSVNFAGGAGEMSYLSMDGQTEQTDVEGLEQSHHDFTVMPGGKVATLVWTAFVIEPESDVVIRSPDGTLETPFRVGDNLYTGFEGRFHANAIHYIEEDDSFTISERNDILVKVSSSGELQWQLGGSCEDAPAGAARCSSQTWQNNHGHHLLADGSFLVFNNNVEASGSHIIELDIQATESSMSATIVEDYDGTVSSGILGDVQRLPGGNTLITYSDEAQIVEVDAEWQVVQTWSGEVGYADWRPTLYGPPVRL